VPRGLEALILAQSDVPTTGALSLMMKWEKVVAEGRVMRLLCVVPVSCRIVWFLLLLFACKSRCLCVCVVLLRFRLAYSICLLNRLG
jgi:hypothetical protein